MLATAPNDQAVRDVFVRSLDENFSVICPAGSGKTKGISDRIAFAASRPDASRVLPTLAVVTFTQDSAEEMQERARAQILAGKPSPGVLMAFNRSFFGTIHSFAVSLLRSHGHYLGIPSMFDVLENDELVWREFLHQHNGRPSRMNPETFDALTRVYPFGNLLALVRSYDFVRQAPVRASAMPLPDLAEVLAFPPPKRAAQAANIKAHQAALKAWRDTVATAGDFAPLPTVTTGGEEFLCLVGSALASFRRWMGEAVAEAVHELAEDYREFRIRKGQLTFNDQVALAAALLRHKRAARDLRAKNFRIILDEAQDTDPHQFALLTEITRPVDAGTQSFIDTLADGPRPGHFCMVGDPQQSIYGDRADLGYYLAVHRALLVSECARELKFQVTFRCDRNIVDFCNDVFPSILTGTQGQVAYVNLEPRPDAGEGQVLRVPVANSAKNSAEGERRDLAAESAAALARWLKKVGLDSLRARSWSEVAILCPRKDWFASLRQALGNVGLRCQFQSTRDIRGDSPAFAWFTALMTIWAEPKNALEVFGVLREVFGHSDHDIAEFAGRNAARLCIETAPGEQGTVSDSLRMLCSCRGLFSELPLREAVGEACRRVGLRDRLAALPADVYPSLARELETLLLHASDAEASGSSLEEFAADLRTRFEEKVEAEDAGDDALPVITNLKAKGLQWDCVVLPFFGREISYRSAPYPRFLPSGCPVPVAFGAGEIPDDWAARLASRRRQETERILYVSLTRAKRTLVLVDDVALWGTADGQPAKNSLAQALRVDADSRAPWEGVPSDAYGSFLHEDKTASTPDIETEDIPPVEKVPEFASKFPLRVLPHELAKSHRRARRVEDPEQAALVHPDHLTASLEDGPAVRYGSWWHALMQAMPWTGGESAIAETIRHFQAFSPDLARSTRELDILRGADLFRKLTSGDFRIHTELPFMAPLKGGDSVDGIIDLAARNEAAGFWIVVDWKTNRDADSNTLLEEYGDQVRAYRDSLAAMVQEKVEGSLYATAAGVEIAV